MLIDEFCDKHQACPSGRTWALSTRLTTMSELIRHPDLSPKHFRWIISRTGVLSHKDAVLFACFCARQNWKKLTDERSKKAVEVAEAWTRGEASVDEASSAASSAYAAYAASSAASSAYAASSAAYAAASSAYAASSSAYAAYAASSASAYAAASSAYASAYAYASASSAYASAYASASDGAYSAQRQFVSDYLTLNF